MQRAEADIHTIGHDDAWRHRRAELKGRGRRCAGQWLGEGTFSAECHRKARSQRCANTPDSLHRFALPEKNRAPSFTVQFARHGGGTGVIGADGVAVPPSMTRCLSLALPARLPFRFRPTSVDAASLADVAVGSRADEGPCPADGSFCRSVCLIAVTPLSAGLAEERTSACYGGGREPDRPQSTHVGPRAVRPECPLQVQRRRRIKRLRWAQGFRKPAHKTFASSRLRLLDTLS